MLCLSYLHCCGNCTKMNSIINLKFLIGVFNQNLSIYTFYSYFYMNHIKKLKTKLSCLKSTEFYGRSVIKAKVCKMKMDTKDCSLNSKFCSKFRTNIVNYLKLLDVARLVSPTNKKVLHKQSFLCSFFSYANLEPNGMQIFDAFSK